LALAPLLAALVRSRTTGLPHAFALGAASGGVYFAGTLYWVTHVMVQYGGLHLWSAILVNALLVGFVTLFPAVFALIMTRLLLAFGPRALLFAPLVWVMTEWGRTHLFGGFPWVLLGYSQVTVLPIAQLASVLGVYGVSALVAGASAAAVFSVETKSTRHRRIVLASVGAAILIAALWGRERIARGARTKMGEAVRVGLVQGNVDQGEKWNAARASSIFQDYLRMTRQAIDQGSDLVIWPESSTPFVFEEDRAAADMVLALARQTHVPILLGSDQIVRGRDIKFYNAAFLIHADGTIGGVYRKMHLVPFGEYVPMRGLLFFAAPLVESVSDFSAGDQAVLLPFKGHLLSTAICYEIVYPAISRGFVLGGSELLTTITNDAWFGHTSAPYQHFAQAAMRAIEEGRYLVRAANTGISGIVDPYGRVLAASPIFQPAVIVGSVRLVASLTPYARMGDLFAYASTLATLALLLAARRRVQ
jgi:apolipoprotein N-acyltransferase